MNSPCSFNPTFAPKKLTQNPMLSSTKLLKSLYSACERPKAAQGKQKINFRARIVCDRMRFEELKKIKIKRSKRKIRKSSIGVRSTSRSNSRKGCKKLKIAKKSRSKNSKKMKSSKQLNMNTQRMYNYIKNQAISIPKKKMLKIKGKTSRNKDPIGSKTQGLGSHFRIAYTDPSCFGSSAGELTDTDPCINYCDQFENTEKDCFTSQDTETHFPFNHTQEIVNQNSDIGLDEGLGEPELEEENQKKIIPRRKKRTSIIKIKDQHFLDDSKEVRMLKNVLGENHKNDRDEFFKNTVNPKNDLCELFDPNQIINELTYRLHHHSKSDIEQEFKPLYKTHRPTIVVEGEEHKEEDSGYFTNLLCSAPPNPISKSPNPSCLSTTNAITIIPNNIEKRITRLDRTIEDISEINPNLAHTDKGFDPIKSQKSPQCPDLVLKENDDFIKNWKRAKEAIKIKIEGNE
ncbi:unnamed protein product [Moneuplotes crassus]|uniref:Uncharacterized protein n=1 Tax=Euplotes crassus TaxID=5936 RepID=A0AAD1U2V1_EUPCR|nr:unnamed protein product [Moneuplotes crassus]